jgi:hypothetical protein
MTKPKKPQNRKSSPPAEALVTRRQDGTFNEGVSGNPGGRPTKVKHLVLQARDALQEKVLPKLIKAVDEEWEDWIRAAALLMAYGMGKPPEFEAVESMARAAEADLSSGFRFELLKPAELKEFRRLLAKGYAAAGDAKDVTPATAQPEVTSNG